MNQLSGEMGLAKSTITRLVNNMVRRGWIKRERDHGDKRTVAVCLIPRGREMAEKLGASSQNNVQRIINHIPREKLPQLIEYLKWVVDSMGKEIPAN